MQVAPWGIHYTTRKLIVEPLDDAALGKAILDAYDSNRADLEAVQRATRGATLREAQRLTRDEGDPRSVGWTILLNKKDPDRAARLDAIQPLAKQRGWSGEPLYYNDEKPYEWYDWVSNSYSPLNAERPFYVLILGGPAQVPFLFQSFLATNAAVGRLDLEPDQVRAYAEKVVRLEKTSEPIVKRETIFFATNHSIDSHAPIDPTYYSHYHLAAPMAQQVQDAYKFAVKKLFAQDATKANLADALHHAKPALVFTASHGLGAPDEPLKRQKLLNGAICCQDEPSDDDEAWLFGAWDVPTKDAFLEGALFFQFACFGYGTPAQSDFAHWDARIGRAVNAKQDFVAALPKKLLAHPHGPIGFVGHLDIALLHGFEDPNNPGTAQDPWHVRVAPFTNAVRNVLQLNPVGFAMRAMNRRYNELNQNLTTFFDQLQRRAVQVDAVMQQRLVDTFLSRSDAQNYLIFGDPGARLRLPD
jgi:hypothetical protein